MSNEPAPKLPQAQLTHDEAKIIVMALTNQIEELTKTSKNQAMPWTPESRAIFKEMLDAAHSARDKITSLTGLDSTLPDYEEGDDLKFLTRPS